MKTTFTYFLLIGFISVAAIFSFTGCGKDDGDFRTIVFSGSGNAYLNNAAKNKITKKSSALVTHTSKGILTVSGSGDVYIDINDLDSLIASGSISISGKSTLNLGTTRIVASGISSINLDVKANKIMAKASGEKSYTLTGSTTDLELTEAGNGAFSGFGLSTSNCTLNLFGSHDCEVNVSNTLTVNLAGSGNVYYIGNPSTVNQTITGTGKLIKK